MTPPIGAHASALMALRAKSLQAYGLDPHALMISREQSMTTLPESPTRSLAKITRESRALAVETEHALVAL